MHLNAPHDPGHPNWLFLGTLSSHGHRIVLSAHKTTPRNSTHITKNTQLQTMTKHSQANNQCNTPNIHNSPFAFSPINIIN